MDVVSLLRFGESLGPTFDLRVIWFFIINRDSLLLGVFPLDTGHV